MLIKCQSCGHENQLGSIFCRGCGGKLEVEQLRPKVVDTKAATSGVGGIIRKAIGLIVFLGLVFVILMLFYPDDLSNYAALSGDNAVKAVKEKFESIQKKAEQGFGNDSYTLSAQEVTYIYNSLLHSKTPATATDKNPAPAAAAPADAPAYNIEKLTFDIDSAGFVHMILTTKLFDQIPVTFEMKGSVVNASTKEAGKTSISFFPTEFKMGHLPIKFVESQVISKFMPALAGQKTEQILKAISKVEVNDAKSFVVKF